MNELETMVFEGSEIKALDAAGKVGGYLVRFTSPSEPDLEGDYFDADTDFDVDEWPAKTAVYYHHGLDSTLKHRRLGKGEMSKDNVGVWVEAQLEMRDAYEQEVFRLVQEGKMGWSSGTAGHLVEREPTGKAYHFKRWPLGLDASITPTPAEYRNRAVELKTLMESDPSFEALMPEAGGNPAAGADDAEIEVPDDVKSEENGIMANEATETKSAPDVSAELLQKFAELSGTVNTLKTALEKEPPVNAVKASAPVVLKEPRGDTESNAWRAFVKSGDLTAFKASNNTDMNIGTAADGGYTVPTGHYNGIIARRDESMLAPLLGVTRITGQGTTVNVPVDNEADGEFVATNEATDFDRDAPAISQVAMTLVKYTKTIELSDELLQDEDSNLMEFINNFIGRGLAKTHNSLLVTAAGAGGTAALALDSATVIGVSEIPELVYLLPDPYQDSAKWLMRRAVEGEIRSLVSASDFQYVPKWMGTVTGRPELWGYPVFNSEYAGATAASAKSLFFGDWSFMALREAPSMTVVRDPYSKARQGQVCLHYHFRAVYKVLQAEAIIYAAHPSA